jgi:phage protein D
MKFKDYHYTDVSEEGAAQNQESDIEFMLLLPTQYEQISVVMTVTLKMSTECIIYSSYPCKNY